RIGVIKNGRLLVVEEKSELLSHYGRRTVRLRLDEQMNAIPERLRAAGAALEDDGRALLFTTRAGETLVAPLQAASAEGLRIADVQTREPRLETVIVELLRGKEGEANAVAEARAALRRDLPAANTPPASVLPEPEVVHGLLGLRTLFRKEVKRFLRVPGQTILSPLITTALYFLVFGYSLGGRLREVDGVPYGRFLVPGLVMLGIINNSFLNTSSSLFIMKLQGTIVDLLVTPLSYLEILAAFVGAGCTRALLVGVLTWITAAFFVGPALPHLLLAVIAAVLVALAFASCGLIVALWAEKFEQVNFIPTFVITPLTFLGGVFYSASMLSPSLRRLLALNPIYYMIESMRFSLVGTTQIHSPAGFALSFLFAVIMLAAALALLRRGYKLRT
ncbi:MAG: ABC transporter permease, partial [Myxococcales bacterium]